MVASIQDYFLNDIAAALNGESIRLPAYLLTSTTPITSLATSATSLSGEIGTRVTLTGSRLNNVLTLSGIRSGAIVLQSTGDDLETSGISSYSTASTSTNDLFLGTSHSGLLQTTNFDLEFIYNIAINRG